MQDLVDPDEKILCPYDSAHHIRRCKMAFHIVKCKKNFGEQRMVACDFNATHMIPEPELRYHHQICPDRKKLEAQIVEAQAKPANKFPIAQFEIEQEECWDDVNVPSYDPKAYTEKSQVLRQLDVESAAKRKNFRLNERQRMAALTAGETSVQPQNEARTLPAHRPVTNITANNFNPAMLESKLKLDKKLYVPQK